MGEFWFFGRLSVCAGICGAVVLYLVLFGLCFCFVIVSRVWVRLGWVLFWDVSVYIE